MIVLVIALALWCVLLFVWARRETAWAEYWRTRYEKEHEPYEIIPDWDGTTEPL